MIIGDSIRVRNKVTPDVINPLFSGLVADYYSKERAYQLCILTRRLSEEITTIDQAMKLLNLLMQSANDFMPIVVPEIKANTDSNGNVNYQNVINLSRPDFENILLKLLKQKGYGN